MATFLRLFNRAGSTSSPGRPVSYEDKYQKITDNQPLNDYKDVLLLNGHTDPVKHVLKVNQSCFLTAGNDARIIVWNCETGHQMYILEEHTSPITAVCLLKDYVGGAYGGDMASDDVISIMSASNNEMIKWELATADERLDCTNSFTRIVEHQGKINCLTVLKHGLLCSGGTDLCLWDSASGKLLSRYEWALSEDNAEIFSVLELEGRSFGVVAVSNHEKPAVFDIKKSTMSQMVTYNLEFCCRVISYHHLPISVLAAVSNTLFVTGALDGTVVIWSMNSLNMVKRFECVEDQGYHFTQSMNATPTSAQPGNLPVTHIMTLCERYIFVATGSGFKVFDIYSCDGGPVSISEIPSMPRPILVHSNAHKANITSMMFIPEKSMLVTSSVDGSVRLWGSRGAPPPLKKDNVSPTQEVDASAELLKSVENFLGIHLTRNNSRKKVAQARFNLMVPQLIGELSLHTDTVQGLLFLGSGLGVVTVGDDNNVLIWKESDLETEKKDEEIQKHLRGEMFYDANQ